MLAGLEAVDAGRIEIGDRVVNGVSPRDRDVAMVFQDYALYPQMTRATTTWRSACAGAGWRARRSSGA